MATEYKYSPLITEFPDGRKTEADVISGWETKTQVSVDGDYKSPNPYVFYHQLVEANKGRIESVYLPTGEKTVRSGNIGVDFETGYFVYRDSPSQAEIDTVYNVAIERLYEKIRGDAPNFAVSLAEMREVARLGASIGSIAKQFEDIGRQYFDRNASSPIGKAPEAVAGAWLLYTYGIRPLIDDVYAAASYVSSVAGKGLVARASANRTYDLAGRSDSSGSQYNPYTVRGTSKVGCKFSLTYDISNPSLFDASRLGFLNPLALAWELMPFSFVVDWFYDIGSYLQNLEAAFGAGLTFREGYSTTSYEVVATTVQGNRSSSDTVTTCMASGFSRTASATRVRLSSFPYPALPSVDTDLSSSQLLSAAALLQALFGSRNYFR